MLHPLEKQGVRNDSRETVSKEREMRILIRAIVILLVILFLLQFLSGPLFMLLNVPIRVGAGLAKGLGGLFGAATWAGGALVTAAAVIFLVLLVLKRVSKTEKAEGEQDEPLTEIHSGIDNMEKRIESLETILTQAQGNQRKEQAGYQ